MSHTLRNTRRLLAALATLTLAAGPALAQSAMLERVEVQGGRVIETVPRSDVHVACPSIDDELTRALARTWHDTHRFGEVNVQFVLENGQVSAVTAKGVSNTVARSVRSAMYRVDCAAQKTAEAQVYRFTVALIDPNPQGKRSSDGTRTAARSVRISSGS
ncbi:hypothetical protein [Roseateles sp. LKC17W]|uniref:Uncharacterized protein n=1 Tax=Pelomonas margarita TaxID=3299031 RepID=A0ABW7FPL4_9BURK